MFRLAHENQPGFSFFTVDDYISVTIVVNKEVNIGLKKEGVVLRWVLLPSVIVLLFFMKYIT